MGNNENYVSLHYKGLIYTYGITQCMFVNKLDIAEKHIFALKLHMTKEWVAIGGWFDKVIIYDFKDRKNIFEVKYPGSTASLEFLYDKPTLAILKSMKLYFCDVESKKCIVGLSPQNANYLGIKFIPESGALYLLNKAPTEVNLLSYSSSNEINSFKISQQEIWTLTSFKPNYYLVGGSLHILYIFDRGNGRVDQWENLHSQGITRLIQSNNFLISSSDDKTLKISYPLKKEIVKSIDAHESLINDIYYSKWRNVIYTASSDGSFKKWALPTLELLAEVKNLPSLATIYWLEDKNFMTLGTWEKLYLTGKLENNQWQEFQRLSIDSRGVYSQCRIRNADLFLILGVEPNQLYLYDLKSKTISNFNFIPSFYTICQEINNNSVAVVSSGFIAILSFDRASSDYIIKFKASLIYYINDNVFSAAFYDQDKNELAVGASDGKLIILPSSLLIQKGVLESSFSFTTN